jgi:hypothetical protein
MKAIHFSETERMVEQHYYKHNDIYYNENESSEIGKPLTISSP